jgi:ankyrin repeat protein
MSDALPLPPRPNLEQYRKLAKDLQHACKSETPGAIRDWAVRTVESLARLGVEVAPWTQRPLDRQAARLERRWRAFRDADERRARCLLADAQFFIACEHGFASWPKFAAHLESLTDTGSSVSNFEAAVDAIVNGDVTALRTLLAEHPALVHARSTRDHRSTLLHYVSANGVEDFRQKTPKNIVEIAKILLDAGADPEAESEAYGGGSTTLGLVATSLHPEEAGVQIALLETLLERGARIEHPGLAGNSHGAVRGCLANGQGDAARFFADRGAHMELDEAAGVGRLDVVQQYFDEKGALTAGATREQMESGFLYACGYGHRDVARFLLDRGVDPETRNDRSQTGVHWAAYGPHVEIVKLLLERGARADVQDQLSGSPLDWIVNGWAQYTERTELASHYEAVVLLARAGARLNRAWFEANDRRRPTLQKVEADARMQAALRGEISPGHDPTSS